MLGNGVEAQKLLAQACPVSLVGNGTHAGPHQQPQLGS